MATHREPDVSDAAATGGHVAAIVLAAGRSERMGEPKQVLLLRGKPLLTRVLDALRSAGVAEIIVVLGADADRVRREILLEGTQPVVHPGFTEGMSSSLRAGVGAASSRADAFLIVLGDQPLVAPGTIRTLVDRHASARRRILVPTFAGVRGNPVLLPRAFSGEITATRGDVGCRDIVRRHPDETDEVAVDDAGILLDIDTPDDLHRLEDALKHPKALEELVADRVRNRTRSPGPTRG